jgi:sugar phosphate permease
MRRAHTHAHNAAAALLCMRVCLPPGLSKFLGGMAGAALSPRIMLACGLMATSVINVAFGFTSGVYWWTALWALNGALQVRVCARACVRSAVACSAAGCL